MTFQDIIYKFLDLTTIIIPIVASLALLAFLWGLAKFISKAGGDKDIAEGRNLMIWGTIALFVLVSIWGILRFMSDEVGFTGFGIPVLPVK